MIGSALGQSVIKKLETKATFRIAFSAWILACTVLMEFFKGDLAGHFVTPGYSIGPVTFKELALTRNYFISPYIKQPHRNHSNDCVRSNAYVLGVIRYEARLTRDPAISMIAKTLRNCSNQVEGYYIAYEKMVREDCAIFIAEMQELHGLRGKLRGELVYFSRDFISSKLCIRLFRNIFEEDILSVFRKMMAAGLIQKHLEIHRDQQRAGIGRDIVKGKRDQGNISLGGVSNLVGGGKKGPVALNFSHMSAFLLVMTTFLGVAGIIVVVEKYTGCQDTIVQAM